MKRQNSVVTWSSVEVLKICEQTDDHFRYFLTHLTHRSRNCFVAFFAKSGVNCLKKLNNLLSTEFHGM